MREVYEIDSWHAAGTTPYKTREPAEVQRPGRVEFQGPLAPDEIRTAYLNGSVEAYFRRGLQSPVAYVNVEQRTLSAPRKTRLDPT